MLLTIQILFKWWKHFYCVIMVTLKVSELSVNQESISFQIKKNVVNIWSAITRLYFKDNIFKVTDVSLTKKSTVTTGKSWKGELCLNFFVTGRVVVNPNVH